MPNGYEIRDWQGNLIDIDSLLQQVEYDRLIRSIEDQPRISEVESTEPFDNQPQAYIPQGLEAVDVALGLGSLAMQRTQQAMEATNQQRAQETMQGLEAVSRAAELGDLYQRATEVGMQAGAPQQIQFAEPPETEGPFPYVPEDLAEMAKRAQSFPGFAEPWGDVSGMLPRPDGRFGALLQSGTPVEQAVGGGLEGVAELAEGLANFFGSTKGALELIGAKTPIAPGIYAKWAYDMISSGLVSGKEAVESFQKGDWKAFGKHVVEAASMGIFGAKAARHGYKEIPKTIQAVEELKTPELRQKRMAADAWYRDNLRTQHQIEQLSQIPNPNAPTRYQILKLKAQLKNRGLPKEYENILREEARNSPMTVKVVWGAPHGEGVFATPEYDPVTGKAVAVQFHGEEVGGHIHGLPRRNRQEAIRRSIQEEVIHSHTTKAEAQAAYDSANRLERYIAQRNYGGDKLSPVNLGFEIIRQRLQRRSGTTREAAESQLLDNLSVRALEKLDDLSQAWGRGLAGQLPPGELELLVNRVRENIETSKKAAAPEGEDPAARTINQAKFNREIYAFSAKNKVDPDILNPEVVKWMTKQPVNPEILPLVEKFVAEYPEYRPGEPPASRSMTYKEWEDRVRANGPPLTYREWKDVMADIDKKYKNITQKEKKEELTDFEENLKTTLSDDEIRLIKKYPQWVEYEERIGGKPGVGEPNIGPGIGPASRSMTYQKWKARKSEVPLSFQEWRDLMDDIAEWQVRTRKDRSPQESEMRDQLDQDHAQLMKQYPQWLEAETQLMQEGGETPGIPAGLEPGSRSRSQRSKDLEKLRLARLAAESGEEPPKLEGEGLQKVGQVPVPPEQRIGAVEAGAMPKIPGKATQGTMEELMKLRQLRQAEEAGVEPPRLEAPVYQKVKPGPVAPGERLGAEEGGALPRISGVELEKQAQAILEGPITSRLGKARETKEGFVPGRMRFAYPDFSDFSAWAHKNMEGVHDAQIRQVWEDVAWRTLLNASPERLAEWRHAMGLESSMGRRDVIGPPPKEVTFRLEQEFHEGKRYGAQILKEEGAFLSSNQRYRNKLIEKIVLKLVSESFEGRPELSRSDISIADLDFHRQTPAYEELGKRDIADMGILLPIIRKMYTPSVGDPRTATRRLVAVVDNNGRVHLLSTYPRTGERGAQQIVDPTAPRGDVKLHRPLDASFMKQFRPFATLLLEDPVQGFHQKFETVSEFMDKIGEEALERSKIGEFPGEGPGPVEGFEAEGTAGLEGEGGMVIGPESGRARALLGMTRGTLESKAPLTDREVGGIVEHILDEVGDFDVLGDVRISLDILQRNAASGKLTPTDRLALSGYVKAFRELERQYPDEPRENLIDLMANRIYESYTKSDPAKPETFVRAAMAAFSPKGAEASGPVPAGPTRTGAKEITIPTTRRPIAAATGPYGGTVARRAADIARRQAEAAKAKQGPARLSPEEQAYVKGRPWDPADPELRRSAGQASGEAMEPVPEYGQAKLLERGKQQREAIEEAESENFLDYQDDVAAGDFKGTYQEWKREHNIPSGLPPSGPPGSRSRNRDARDTISHVENVFRFNFEAPQKRLEEVAKRAWYRYKGQQTPELLRQSREAVFFGEPPPEYLARNPEFMEALANKKIPANKQREHFAISELEQSGFKDGAGILSDWTDDFTSRRDAVKLKDPALQRWIDRYLFPGKFPYIDPPGSRSRRIKRPDLEEFDPEWIPYLNQEIKRLTKQFDRADLRSDFDRMSQLKEAISELQEDLETAQSLPAYDRRKLNALSDKFNSIINPALEKDPKLNDLVEKSQKYLKLGDTKLPRHSPDIVRSIIAKDHGGIELDSPDLVDKWWTKPINANEQLLLDYLKLEYPEAVKLHIDYLDEIKRADDLHDGINDLPASRSRFKEHEDPSTPLPVNISRHKGDPTPGSYQSILKFGNVADMIRAVEAVRDGDKPVTQLTGPQPRIEEVKAYAASLGLKRGDYGFTHRDTPEGRAAAEKAIAIYDSFQKGTNPPDFQEHLGRALGYTEKEIAEFMERQRRSYPASRSRYQQAKEKVAPGLTEMIRSTASAYDEWMVDRIARVGGDMSKIASDQFKEIIDRQKVLYGELSPKVTQAKILAGATSEKKYPLVGNVPTIGGQKAALWLNKRENITPYTATRRVVEAMEGAPRWSEATKMWGAKRERYTDPETGIRKNAYRIIRTPIPVPDYVEKVMGPAREANLQIGKMLEPVTSRRFIAHGLFQRNLTATGYDMVREGKGKAWERWTEGVAVANKMELGQVREFFRDWKAKLDKPGVDVAMIEKANQDFVRKYPKLVTDVKVGGQWIEVVHANLFNYLENAAQRASHLRAFREVFPRTREGRKSMAELRESVVAEIGDVYQKDFDAMVRTLQGQPTDSYANWGLLGPTRLPGAMFRMFNNTIGNLMARMVLTGQMIVQMPETFVGATPSFLGYKNYARAGERWIKDLAKERQLYAQMEQQGKVNQVIYDFSLDPNSPIRSMFRIAGNTISKTFAEQFPNELQEKLATTTAEVVVERIKAKTITKWEDMMIRQTFKDMGFDREQIQAMMQEQASLSREFAPDEVASIVEQQNKLLDQFVRKAAPFLTSGNKAVAESSRIGANRLFNSIFRFQSYPMMKAQQFRRVMTSAAEAWHSGDKAEKVAAANQLARFLFNTTMQGALTVAMTSWLYERTAGLKIRKEEAEDDPIIFLAESFIASIGGPLYIVWRGARHKGLAGVGEQATRVLFPYEAIREMTDMAQSEGKYHDLSLFDRIGKFIEAKAPGTKAISTGLALVGLSQDDRALETSIKAFNRWKVRELGYKDMNIHLEEDIRADFRKNILKAVKALKQGDQEAFNDAYLEAGGALLGLPSELTPKQRIASSFRQRKLLKTPDNQPMTQEQKERLEDHIGFDAFNRLENYDRMLDLAADKAMVMPRQD